jgi:hypothetical protein
LDDQLDRKHGRMAHDGGKRVIGHDMEVWHIRQDLQNTIGLSYWSFVDLNIILSIF